MRTDPPAVGAQRQRARAQRHRGRAAAAGAARGTGGVVRVPGDAVPRAVRDALPAELRRRGLRPGTPPRLRACAPRRARPRPTAPSVEEDQEPRRVGPPRCSRMSFTVTGTPVERSRRLAAAPPLRRLAGLCERFVTVDADEGVHMGLYLLGLFERGAGGLDGGEVSCRVPGEELRGGEAAEIRHGGAFRVVAEGEGEWFGGVRDGLSRNGQGGARTRPAPCRTGTERHRGGVQVEGT